MYPIILLSFLKENNYKEYFFCILFVNVLPEGSAVQVAFSLAEDIKSRLDFLGACGVFNQHNSAQIGDEHDHKLYLRGLSFFNFSH